MDLAIVVGLVEDHVEHKEVGVAVGLEIAEGVAEVHTAIAVGRLGERNLDDSSVRTMERVAEVLDAGGHFEEVHAVVDHVAAVDDVDPVPAIVRLGVQDSHRVGLDRAD